MNVSPCAGGRRTLGPQMGPIESSVKACCVTVALRFPRCRVVEGWMGSAATRDRPHRHVALSVLAELSSQRRAARDVNASCSALP